MKRMCFETAKDFWNIKGSFGLFDAPVQKKEGTFIAQNDSILVKTEVKEYENGVFLRTGSIKNITDAEVVVNTLSLKFRFDGGEYEVYSQYNGWQNESLGGWQPLVTAVSARCENIRSCDSAAPFMVLWSNQTNRGTAFHLNTYSAWEMRIERRYIGCGDAAYVAVDAGVLTDGFCLTLAPGEEMELPEVIFYTVTNKIDLDCWKLHGYLNKMYPRKTMPVIYNSWMYKFDRFTYDDIKVQADKAKELGVEYFVIDAGWFGDGDNWGANRGDWQENLSYGFKGRMLEMAEYVRSLGMKFGFWLEPETAACTAEIVSKHPDWYFEGVGGMLLDFTVPEAAEHIFNKTCALIDRFGAEFVKFDFNVGCTYDKDNASFIRYFQGHTRFIKRLKEKYPHLYIENCSSGGMRMAIRDGKLYDSYWMSDNQSPYFGTRIFKDSIKRMPPQWIESWATYRSLEGFKPLHGSDDSTEKLLSCCDATWDLVFGTRQSYMEAFLKGSPIGLSFDLTSLSQKAFSDLKLFIEKFKEKRDFWQKCVCKILADTETVLVLEYCSADLSQAEVVAFAGKIVQKNLCIYPVLNESTNYKLSDGTVKTGAEIMQEGIDFDTYNGSFTSYNFASSVEMFEKVGD